VTGLPWHARHATTVDGMDVAGAAQVAAVAAMLGTPLMPWQHVAARILEARHASTGRLANPFVVVTVPRQAGKSTLLLAVLVKRALLDGVGRRLWYTAQNGNAAAEKWGELARLLCSSESPLAGRVAARWTNGSQALTFPNGSTLRPFPPTRDSLHGKQASTVVIDEGFSFDAVRGVELLQAVGPTQAAVLDPQTVVVSTQGDALSTWLHGLIDRGRAGAPGVAYLEYGIGDAGAPARVFGVNRWPVS
jgi:phage terminase large subunit-like protein